MNGAKLTEPAGSRNIPFDRKDAETLDRVLRDMAVEIRFNTRARCEELRQLGIYGSAQDWTRFTDRSTADLREQIARQFWYRTAQGPSPLKFGREAWRDAINALLAHREIDPFCEWLEQLHDWQGKPHLERLLIDLFGAPNDALSRWAARYLFVGGVQRTYEPGCKLDEMPVLIGAQGIGKSALLREMVPPEIPGLHSDGLRWDARPQEQVDAVLGRVIVEVSEMSGRRRAELDLMKTFVTRPDDGVVRRPWAHHTEPLPRRFILVGTTNREADLPNDPSGNRRFVPIPLTKGADVESFMGENRGRLWAEARYMYELDVRANLPRDLMAAQASRAEEHRDRDDVIEDAVANLPDGARLTMGEVIGRLPDDLRKLTQNRIGRALSNAGWKSSRVRIDGRQTRVWGKCVTS